MPPTSLFDIESSDGSLILVVHIITNLFSIKTNNFREQDVNQCTHLRLAMQITEHDLYTEEVLRRNFHAKAAFQNRFNHDENQIEGCWHLLSPVCCYA